MTRRTSRNFGLDGRWWDDVRSAAIDPQRAANGMTLWEYLADLDDGTEPYPPSGPARPRHSGLDARRRQIAKGSPLAAELPYGQAGGRQLRHAYPGSPFTWLANLRQAAGLKASTGPWRSLVSRTRT